MKPISAPSGLSSQAVRVCTPRLIPALTPTPIQVPIARLGLRHGTSRAGRVRNNGWTEAGWLNLIHRGLRDGDDRSGVLLTVDPEHKTIATAAGTLPISPLLDPAWLYARNNFRRGIPEAGALPRTGLSRMLEDNPYALALAMPIRMCNQNRIALPRYFLQAFALVNGGTHGSGTWWAPEDLWVDAKEDEWHIDSDPMVEDADLTMIELCEPAEVGEAVTDADADADADSRIRLRPEDDEPSPAADMAADTAVDATVEWSPSDPAALEPDQPPAPFVQSDRVIQPTEIPPAEIHAQIGVAECVRRPVKPVPIDDNYPSAYMRRNHDVVAACCRRAGFRLTALPPSWASLAYAAVWRPDMETFLLYQHRRSVALQLIQLANRTAHFRHGFLVPLCDPAEAHAFSKRGCLLWFADEPAEATAVCPPFAVRRVVPDPDSSPVSSTDAQLDRLDKLVWLKSFPDGDFAYDPELPVHNLNYLLGVDLAATLRTACPSFRDHSFFLIRKGWTMVLLNELWRLQGYLLTAALRREVSQAARANQTIGRSAVDTRT